MNFSVPPYSSISSRVRSGWLRSPLAILVSFTLLLLGAVSSSAQPCLWVSDLDFGTLGLGVSKILPLELCNNGTDDVTFTDSTSTGGGGYLTWLLNEFSVSQSDIDKLKATVLGPGDCVTINVTFVANQKGVYRTVARIWANTRQCRDTSAWSARVAVPGPDITLFDWDRRWISSADPCTKNSVVEYEGVIEVSNFGDADFRVDSLTLTGDPSFRIGTTNVVPGKIIRPGQVENVEVWYKPLTQKTHVAGIAVHYVDPSTGAISSISGVLEGIGVESCLTRLSDTISLVSSGVGATVTVSAIYVATGTRPVTITQLTISGVDAAGFLMMSGQPGMQLPVVIDPGDSATFNVSFNPASANQSDWHATLEIEGDFPDEDCAGSCSRTRVELIGRIGTASVGNRSEGEGNRFMGVAPNPAQDRAIIAFSLAKGGTATFELYDQTGRQITSLPEQTFAAGEHQVEWDLSGIPAGEYFVRIQSGEWESARAIRIVR